MSYKQIKWLIILVPMLALEVWEIVRHEYLHAFISMSVGNWLSAFIVLTVTLLLTIRLFKRMEQLQEELNRERADKAVLIEREKIARELHDGIAQSLFLLSVKMNRLESSNQTSVDKEQLESMKETIRRVHDDVRLAISNLRIPPTSEISPWTQNVKAIIEEFKNNTGLIVDVNWDKDIDEEVNWLSAKDKIEINACLREALMNIRKHANASQVKIDFFQADSGWHLRIEDDGVGFQGDPIEKSSSYGLRMIRERATEMGWNFSITRNNHRTRVDIRKENIK